MHHCTKYAVRSKACGETAAVKSQCREGVVWFDGTCLCLIHKATIYGAVSSVRSMYGVVHAKPSWVLSIFTRFPVSGRADGELKWTKPSAWDGQPMMSGP